MDLRQDKALQDAGKRLADTVRLHFAAASDIMSIVGQWCVFKLEDGSSDNVLYDSKDAAVSAMKGRSKDYCYLKITPDGISDYDASRFLHVNRNMYVQTDAPEHVTGPAIFPRFSNLTEGQKRIAKAEAEREYRERNK